MKITNFRYSRTVNPKDAFSETLEAHVELDDGEKMSEAFPKVKSAVSKLLGDQAAASESTTTNEDGAGASKTAKKTTKKTAKKAAKKTAKKAAKKTAPKNVPYDRDVKAHKTALSTILTDNYEGWNNDEVLAAKAKELSGELVGEDMFDADGNVLDAFILKVTGPMDECFEGGEEAAGDDEL